MGVRGELFSTKVSLQNRTYFFNVKENRLGDLYLNIVESKNRDEGGFDRQSVILFADDLQEFLQGFDESLRVLEKASREKRRGKSFPGAGRDSNRESARENNKDSDRESYREGKRESGRDSGREYNRESRRDNGSGTREPPRRSRDENFSSSSAPRQRRESRFQDKPQWKKSDGPGRGPGREEYKDRTKKETAPRKKRVVVKKQ